MCTSVSFPQTYWRDPTRHEIESGITNRSRSDWINISRALLVGNTISSMYWASSSPEMIIQPDQAETSFYEILKDLKYWRFLQPLHTMWNTLHIVTLSFCLDALRVYNCTFLYIFCSMVSFQLTYFSGKQSVGEFCQNVSTIMNIFFIFSMHFYEFYIVKLQT